MDPRGSLESALSPSSKPIPQAESGRGGTDRSPREREDQCPHARVGSRAVTSPQRPLQPAHCVSGRKVLRGFRLVGVRRSHRAPGAPREEWRAGPQGACGPTKPCVWRAGSSSRTSVRVFRGQMGPGPFEGTPVWVNHKDEDKRAPSQCLGPG